MNFRDKLVTDEDGKQFIFTVEMQRKLEHLGLPVEPEFIGQIADKPPVHQERPARYERSDRPEKPVEPKKEVVGPAAIQIDPQTGKYIGQVKWYNTRKGYGFIIRGGGEEIFFHKSGSIDNPTELVDGQWVLYDVEDTNKGPEATDVEGYEGVLPQ